MSEYLNEIIKKIARATIDKKEDNQENINQSINAPKNIDVKNEERDIGGPRISSESFDKLKGIRDNDPKIEAEIKIRNFH